ncbi:uncharacterized protein LOC126911625 [Spodoptera frugiperda]|uniref:Uncharacterized protein LOC126911625 n=1 Tax=Spodoptera frugiperda TaxID=7108 RepID=A0A9R0F1E0_SPOFR|nr:uncharacterized protein LOC126911625 [Spodoptera frugiperda]
MKTALFIVILQIIYSTNCAVISEPNKEENEQKIEELEKLKDAIYAQINEAVNDTIKTLEQSNDTEAKQGIAYMNELQQLVKEFNGTELMTEADIICNSTDENAFNDIINSKNLSEAFDTISGRRKNRPSGYEHIKESLLKYKDFSKGWIGMSKKKQDRLKNLLGLQSKLNDWMKQKEIEKERIRAYKARQAATSKVEVITENCPDFGEETGKKKSKKKGKKGRWPCCRKCCKKSYMGCL